MNAAGAGGVAVPLTAAKRGQLDPSRDWRRLTCAAAGVATLVEALLLQRKHDLFTGGFLNETHLATWTDGAAFMMLVLLLNATAAAPMCALALRLGQAARFRPWAHRFVAFTAGSVPLLAADFLMYQVWSYLGDAFDFGLMFNLTGRRMSEIFAVTAPLVTRPLSLGVLLLGVLLAAAWSLHRMQFGRRAAPVVVPPRRTVLRGSVSLMVLSGVLVAGICMSSRAMTFGLRRTPAGEVAVGLLNALTDFDRDGYGLLNDPRDSAPFDSAIHPYALEIPGNGIDENGVGGDLPADQANYQEPPPPTVAWRQHPPVILFVLESFRADVVGAAYESRSVTPVLDGLANQGVNAGSAWSHNGFTRTSRFHILSGALTQRGGTSLLDDFKKQGYETAYFSAQDDSAFGASMIDYSRLDSYFDARQDPTRRYSVYSTPGSLALPYDVLEEHIQDYLHARRSSNPLFLYVNFHDTHYPYSYPGLNNVLGVDLLPPSLISPARRGDLWRTYLNAAANVDAAIGRVIDAVKINTGVSPAVVVISDHGESLFDGGFLGHGYALNSAQTRIPLIVAGLPMRIPMPFGQASLRDALNEALTHAEGDARPLVEWRRNVGVFQYLGPLETPGEIGWMMADGPFTYDFRTNRVELWGNHVNPDDLVGEPRRMFLDLVHKWESMQLALSRSAQRN